MKILYIAGKYQGKYHDWRSYQEIESHINLARQAAILLAREGIGFFCPHTHCAHFELYVPENGPEFFYELDILIMQRSCDGLLLLPNWRDSKGAKQEHSMWLKYKPIFEILPQFPMVLPPTLLEWALS